MKKTWVERFWEHPSKCILRLFIAVTLFCTLLTFMPKWFNGICLILIIVLGIKMITIWEKDEEKKRK